ncbi:MAG: helix-turn-helix domain-containing protein [Candidatus Dormibacteria bacterium]
MGEIGGQLQKEREARGVSLEQAARITRIRADFLDALEQEDWSRLPGTAYARGFLRVYARALGLPAEELVARFNRDHPPSSARDEVVRRVRTVRPRLVLTPQVLTALAALMLVVAFTTYLARQIQSFSIASRRVPSPSPSVVILSPAPVVVQSTGPLLPAPTPVPSLGPGAAAKLDAAITLDAATWVQVTGDGVVRHQGNYEAGTVLRVGAQQRVRVWATQSGRVRVSVNGVDFGPLGTDSEPLARDFTLSPGGTPTAGPRYVPPPTPGATSTPGNP